MKSILVALCFFGFSQAFARPDDGPVFPWPTGIETREMVAEDLNGDWVAYTTSGLETFYVHFETESVSPYRISVLVKPTNIVGDDERTRIGLGYWGRHLFWGHISMDGERYTRMVIYREEGILKMRIEKPSRGGYFDLRLERWPWGKPL